MLFAQRKSNPNDVNIIRTYVLFRNADNLDMQRNYTGLHIFKEVRMM